jgi:hypothetical protein
VLQLRKFYFEHKTKVLKASISQSLATNMR